ncbi:MAG: hypothetical protein BWY11_02122 [Firmicutes bacterium ADurb.Bin182]|nr:MAG: hypothetical protein BWY11_02122 [Firmicutes bacterium ADurb.Bin182]
MRPLVAEHVRFAQKVVCDLKHCEYVCAPFFGFCFRFALLGIGRIDEVQRYRARLSVRFKIVALLKFFNRCDGLRSVIARCFIKIAERYELSLKAVNIRSARSFEQRVLFRFIGINQVKGLRSRNSVLLKFVLPLEKLDRVLGSRSEKLSGLIDIHVSELHEPFLKHSDAFVFIPSFKGRIRSGRGSGGRRDSRGRSGCADFHYSVIPARNALSSCGRQFNALRLL